MPKKKIPDIISEQQLRNGYFALEQAEKLIHFGYFERNWQAGTGYWSKGFYKLLGVKESEVDCTHEVFMQYVHEDDREDLAKSIEKTLLEKKESDMCFRIVQKNNNIVYIHGTARHFYDKSGKPLKTNGVFQDVTASEIGNRLLKEKEELYQSIFNTAANLILLIDVDRKVIDCNEKIYGMLRYKKNEIIGQKISKILHQDYFEKTKKTMKEVLSYGFSYNNNYKMIRKDGTLLDVSVDSSGLKDDAGNFSKMIYIVSDVTEQVSAMKKIESLTKFPEENPNVVTRVDLDGHVLYLNKSAQNEFFKEKDCIGKKDIPSAWQEAINECWSKGSLIRLEYNNVSSEKMFLLTFTPIKGGPYVNIYGIDISQRKAFEENLHKKIKELEAFSKVTIDRELRMVELKKQIKALEEKLERQKQ